jgi:hypothetical protein
MSYWKVNVNTTGYKLFKSLFRCRTKAKYLLDMEDVELFGMVTTTLDDYDERLANEWREVYLPTSTIAELHSDGCDVELLTPGDAARMYGIISNHLDWWAEKFASALYIDPERVKRVQNDIAILDKLAETLYPMVASDVKKAIKPQYNPVAKPRRRKGTYGLDESVGKESVVVAERTTMEERFPTHVLKRVRAWDKTR